MAAIDTRVDSRVDTLTVSRRLEGVGIDRNHAEAIAIAIESAIAGAHRDLVTKDQLEAAISALSDRLKWRLVIIAGTVIAAVIAAIKIIPAL